MPILKTIKIQVLNLKQSSGIPEKKGLSSKTKHIPVLLKILLQIVVLTEFANFFPAFNILAYGK